MSRIGKAPIAVPNGVTITVGSDNVVTVKGPKGELKESIDRDIKVEVADGKVNPSPRNAWFVSCIGGQHGERGNRRL
jgi:ribosomal protein L6P/L9E